MTKKQELTKIAFQQALWRTREENGGMSIKEIAEMIKDEFDLEEIKALIKELNPKTK